MRKTKFIIILIIINILMNTYINISYGARVDEEGSYEEAWDVDRNGVIDDTEREYWRQGIGVMMPELSQNKIATEEELNAARTNLYSVNLISSTNATAKEINSIFQEMRSKKTTRAQTYDDNPKVVKRGIIANGTKIYTSTSSKPKKDEYYTLTETLTIDNFENYFNTKNTDFEGVEHLFQFDTKYDFYWNFSKDIKEAGIIDNDKKILSLDSINKVKSLNDITNDLLHFFILKQDVAIITIDMTDALEDIKDAEKYIYMYEGINANAYISPSQTLTKMYNINNALSRLNSINEEYGNLISTNTDENIQIETCGFSGQRLQKDINDLETIYNTMKQSLSNSGAIDTEKSSGDTIVLKGIPTTDTSSNIDNTTDTGSNVSNTTNERVIEAVGGTTVNDAEMSEDEYLDLFITYPALETQPSRDYRTTSSGIDEIISEGMSFVDSGSIRNTSGLTDFSTSAYSIFLVAGIFITVIVGLILGIKFLLGSIEEKAEIKKYLWPYLIGCVVIYGGLGIWKFVVTILQSI